MLSKTTVLATAVLVPLLATVPAADAVAKSAPAVPCAMFCEDRPPSAGDCAMFCAEPPAPPADAQGCRMFCELAKPEGEA
ncbi:hypothetical protein [Nocardia sienata]|uniref:hypothetical protein n=1 Tax=Nocardia sienata TaxID=248552 RepID=UPI0007A54D33|nr:hypothetical protein [Nocardia sienata]